MKDLYRAIYSSVKSEESVYKIRSSGLQNEEKERVINFLRKLAHPIVASVWDAYEPAVMCTSGLIPGVSKEAVDDARRVIAEVKKHYPYVEQKQSVLSPPELSEEPTLKELAQGITWTNKILTRFAITLQAVQESSHSSLKAQCPFCLEDVMLLVRNEGIFLKCAKGSTPACKKSEWKLSVAETSSDF